jgi:hypothetical protein
MGFSLYAGEMQFGIDVAFTLSQALMRTLWGGVIGFGIGVLIVALIKWKFARME